MVFEGLTKKYPDEVPVTLARSGWVSACMCSRARACVNRCTSECFVVYEFVILLQILTPLLLRNVGSRWFHPSIVQ